MPWKRTTKGWLAGVLGAALCAVQAWAVPPALVDRAKTDRDWESLLALDLLENLHLSRDQALRLTPIHEEACKLYVAYYERQAALLERALTTYPPYRDQRRAGVGVTPEVENPAVRTHAAIKKTNQDYTDALIALERRVYEDVLSPGQRRLAQAYHATRADIVRRARGIVRVATGVRRGAGAPMVRAAGRGATLERRLESLARERDRLDDYQHPTFGMVGQRILTPAAAHWLYMGLSRTMPSTVREAQRVWQRGTRDVPRERFERDRRAVEELKDDLKNWNLINALHLTRSQAVQLPRVIVQALRVEADRRDRRITDDQMNARRVRLEEAVVRSLQPGQRTVLSEFSTCFKGKPDLRNPIRVGQANVQNQATTWLRRMRGLTGDQVEDALRERLDFEQEHWLGPLTDRARLDRLALMRSVVARAREADDLDFEIDQEMLADAITVRSRNFELTRGINDVRYQLGKPGRVAHLMFSAAFARDVAVRAGQLASAPVVANRTSGPLAENCEKGCALPPRVK